MTTEIRTNRLSRRQQWMWLGLIMALAILVYQYSGLAAYPGVLAVDYVEYMQEQR